MKYVALHYTSINKVDYTPGEIIDGKDIPPEKVPRLLRLNAIRKLNAEEADTSTIPRPASKTLEKPVKLANSDEEEADDDTGEGDNPGDDADDDDESDEPPPEIDVMEGVAPPKAEPDAKPAAKKKAPAKKKPANPTDK